MHAVAGRIGVAGWRYADWRGIFSRSLTVSRFGTRASLCRSSWTCPRHGSEQLYASGYEADALEQRADRVVAFATGEPAVGRYAGQPRGDGVAREVFVSFDNDIKVRTPIDAVGLRARVAARLTRL